MKSLSRVGKHAVAGIWVDRDDGAADTHQATQEFWVSER